MENTDLDPPVGIVLAAGLASRMGEFKQLLPLGDRALVEWVVDQLCAQLERVVVVVGHRGVEVAAALANRPVECVTNPEFASGMSSSVQCGIRAAPQTHAYLICLGDQPFLNGVLEPVLTAARSTARGIVIPTFAGKRGHPLFIRASYTARILSLGPDQGLNTLTRAHRADTLEVPVAHPGALEDLDTPADYQRALKRYQGMYNG